MHNKYFHESEFQYAIKLLESDPYSAKTRFEDYLDKYPKDYYARAYYVILLTRICMFDKAEKEFNYILRETSNNNFYDCNNVKKLKGFEYNMILAKIKLLGAKEEYREILNLLNKHLNAFSEADIRFISYYCRSKLGLLSKETANQNANAYRFNQSVNYNEAAFRNHIKKHEADYNLDTDTPNETIFTPDFPMEKIIAEIKKYIPSNKKLFPGYFDDVYYFKFDNCGRVNNKLTNYFVVVCYHNTTNFITMCPANDCCNMPIVDLNYLKEKVNNQKDDRLSQIEKFNRRFNRR